jgi:hypothetical protein
MGRIAFTPPSESLQYTTGSHRVPVIHPRLYITESPHGSAKYEISLLPAHLVAGFFASACGAKITVQMCPKFVYIFRTIVLAKRRQNYSANSSESQDKSFLCGD